MACILSKAPILWRASYKNIIFGPVTKLTLTRGCQHLTNKTNIYAENQFKLKDNISGDYKLIYREQTLFNFVIGTAYNGGWLGIFYCIFMGGYLIFVNPPEQIGRTDILREGYTFKALGKISRALFLFIGVFISLSMILVGKIIPFRIYHNRAQKLYKAVFAYNVLGKKQIVTFAEGTAVPKFKFLREVLFDINGHTILLDQECFPVPAMRERMIRKTK